MFRSTLNHAAADAAETLADRAQPLIDETRAELFAKLDDWHADYTDRLETSTYVIAGALVIGLITAAVILRNTGS